MHNFLEHSHFSKQEHREFINIRREDGTTRRCLVVDCDEDFTDLEEMSSALERNVDLVEQSTGKRKMISNAGRLFDDEGSSAKRMFIHQEIQSLDAGDGSYGKEKLSIRRRPVDVVDGSYGLEDTSIQGTQSLGVGGGTQGKGKTISQRRQPVDVVDGSYGLEDTSIQETQSLGLGGRTQGKRNLVSQRRQREAIHLIQINQIVVATTLTILLRYEKFKSPQVPRAPYRVRHDWFLNDIIYGSNKLCFKITRMGKETFFKICALLRERNLLKDTKNISVEEQAAMGLYILGHHTRVVSLVAAFERSSESISRHFNSFLKAICSLSNAYIRLPSTKNPHQILNNTKYYPWFKDCIGSIDGTHVMVTADQKIVDKFRGRYKVPTQNVLVAGDFDLRFVYVCLGWEGSSNDMAVLKDSLTNEDGFRVPKGKYFLANTGYTTMPGFISPYRGVRYHLKDFSYTNMPRNEKELFNLRHAQLRNRVERAFGILKMRWRMLTTRSSYPTQTQAAAVLACCVLHNVIMDLNPHGDMFYDPNDSNDAEKYALRAEDDVIYEEYTPVTSARDRKRRNAPWEEKRDEMAALMWIDYEKRMSRN